MRAMRSIDKTARRLGLTSETSGGRFSDLLNWRKPSLTLVLLLSGLRRYVQKVPSLLHRGCIIAGLQPGVETSTGPLVAIAAYTVMALLSSLTAKISSLYLYLDPLNSLIKHAYIDSRHTQQIESHRWLACILEASRAYQRSRDLEASNFQSVRHRYTKKEDSIRARLSDEEGHRHTTKLEVVENPPQNALEIPIFFQARDVDEVWFWKFGTLFRVSQQSPRRGSRPAAIVDYEGYTTHHFSLVEEPPITLRCFSRTRKPLIQFLAYAREEYYKGFRTRLYCRVFTYNAYRWNAGILATGRSLDSIVISEETRRQLLTDVKEFFASQDWYTSRGVPWRRGNSTVLISPSIYNPFTDASSFHLLLFVGIMFSGPPGNGKTSTIQAIASAFDLPIYILPLASRHFRDDELSDAINKLAGKCIVVLEDFDALLVNVSRRTPRATNDSIHNLVTISLSAILNVLDGISSGQGRLIIATTNHLLFLRLDEALLRPGRFDLFVEFRNATQQQARNLFTHFYQDHCSEVDLSERNLTPEGELQERLSRGSEEVKELAEAFGELVKDEEFSVATLQGMFTADL